MYKILVILLTGIVLSACGTKPKIQVRIVPTPTTVVQANSVPLPSREDIIRTFFELINEKRIPEAIGMMSSKMVGDDSTKQTWGVMFNDFDSVKVVKVENSTGENEFQVELAVKVNPRAANSPIPYYGYGDKTDIRFVSLVKSDQGLWKIDGISTGP
jgi:hypothetical protein